MMSELPKASSSSRPARHPCACPPRLHGHHRKNHLLVVFSRVSLSASALGLPVIRVSSVLCFSTTAALACNCSNCCRISRPLDPTSFVPCFPSSSNATDYCAHVRLQPHLEHFFFASHVHQEKWHNATIAAASTSCKMPVHCQHSNSVETTTIPFPEEESTTLRLRGSLDTKKHTCNSPPEVTASSVACEQKIALEPKWLRSGPAWARSTASLPACSYRLEVLCETWRKRFFLQRPPPWSARPGSVALWGICSKSCLEHNTTRRSAGFRLAFTAMQGCCNGNTAGQGGSRRTVLCSLGVRLLPDQGPKAYPRPQHGRDHVVRSEGDSSPRSAMN